MGEMTEELCEELHWSAIYGAVVAQMALQRIADGRGPADDEEMTRIVEEACAIADHAESEACRPRNR